MFDYRYHAISLAAVLIALALGVLLGVAIGDSNLVSSAKSGIVRNLQADLDSTKRQLAAVGSEQAQERAVQTDLYEIVVQNVLTSRKVGLVFLGESSQEVDNLVRAAVKQAGGDISSVVTIREPLNLQQMARSAAHTRYQALGQAPPPQGLIKEFGVRIGHQLVTGGRLLGRVQSGLLGSFNGQFGSLEGLVVMRAAPDGMTPEQAKSTGEFEAGLVTGATAAQATTVGVELSNTEPSQVPWYKAQAISSVDDLDKLSGRAALALALAGARGSWGGKSTADAPLPPPTGGQGKP